MVTAIARSMAEEHAESTQPLVDWAEALRACVESHLRDLQAPAPTLAERLATLAERAQTLVAGMDFSFLFDPARKLFSIGYRVSDGTLDPGRYDLLASEARLTSFLTIARGDVPVSHWFRLGRALTPVESDSVLVSWSGSMFEYLMPALVMRVPAGSLLAQTGELVVARQISYGAERGVPWGVSESSYNVRDLEMTYQYSNFGVPGLGLRFGLVDDVVIAPYATGLAAMIDPSAAVQNFLRLEEAGALGAYGFYEALDYTAQRRPEGTGVAIVRTYMAHHQGMVIVAIANVLHDGAMRARFHAEPIVQATELLLQERTPRDVAVTRPRRDEVSGVADVRELAPAVVRRFTSPHAATPRTHLLSNGRYAVMMTAAGSGYSRWKSLAITRWRDDVTRDLGGTYVFLRNVQSGETWSAGYQPTARAPDRYEVRFAEDRVEIVRRDRAIATTLEVIVSPEDDAEMRRVSLTNHGTRTREIDVTSYAEVVLAEPAADASHPAFSNLFVQTEAVPELDTLLATRRARSRDETPVWLAHVARVEGEAIGALQWETDRARFLGRGRGIGTPQAILDGGPLSNTVGTVLDPIVSLRHRVRLRPGQTVRVVFSTLVAPSRDEAVALADKYRDAATFDRAATLAWTQAQVQLHHLGVTPDEAHLFQSLAAHILYPQRTLRASADVLARHGEGPAALWAHGISGDTPIVLVRIDEVDDVEIVRQLLRAHEYWRMKQLAVDLVILNEHPPSYVQDLQTLLETVVRTSPSYGAGLRLHVVGQQPGEPAHGVVERSGERPVGRNRLRSRRRDRRGVGRNGAADPPGQRDLRGATRPGLQPLHASLSRCRARAPAARAARRSRQDLAAHADERVRAPPAAVGDGVRGVGPRRLAERLGPVRRDRDRSADRGHARPQPVEHGLRGPGGVCRPRRAPDGVDGGPHGVPGTPPDARLSGLGALRLLSGGRRLRFSRSAPGRGGAHAGAPRPRARAHPARGGAAVRRGRRAALVAPAGGPGRSHADLGRSAVAALGGQPLSRGHRRRRHPGGSRRLSRGAAARRRPGGGVSAAAPRRGGRNAVRALRPRPRAVPARRAPRSALDGNGGLERRLEPCRDRRGRRERLARVVPAHGAGRLGGAGLRPGKPAARRHVAAARARAARGARTRGVGWRVVSPRVLRRRDTAGLRAQRRLSYRLHRAVVERALGRGRPRSRAARDDGRGRVSRPPGRSSGRALHAAVRHHGARSRLHQGLPARRARERRPVHACGDLDGDGLRRARRGRPGLRAARHAESDRSRGHAA